MTFVRKTTIVTDPVHKVMDFGSDPVTWTALSAVIDTKTFQRLRRISQLGLASYVFPGATHTRFSHSIGAAFIAHKVMNHLSERAEDNEERKEVNNAKLAVTLAALLHDVGHGPFSHSFEKVLKDNESIKNAPLHENWGATLIKSTKSEIRSALEANKLNPEQIASVFSEDSHNEGFPDYLKEIVSSQIDVDRMDYLVRDSHFAGVETGKTDIWYLIRSLAVARHGDTTKTLGITPKGIKAYEGFLLARHLMNKTVYYHRRVKVLEFMMEQFLREVLKHHEEMTRKTDVAPFIPRYLTSVANVSAGAYDQSFLDEYLEAYVDLTEDRIWTLASVVSVGESQFGLARNLARRLLSREPFIHYPVERNKQDILKGALDAEDLEDGNDFAVVETHTTPYKTREDPVYVINWDGDIDDISKHSELISMLGERTESEQLLVIINQSRRDEILKIADEAQCVSEADLEKEADSHELQLVANSHLDEPEEP